MLETHGLTAFYGDFQALFGIDFTVAEGEIVAVVGANGAGKSTFLKSLVGLLPRPSAGAVRFAGAAVGDWRAERLVGLGLALVPEGRRLFPSLTVEENLRLGGQLRRPGPWTLARVYDLFPALRDCRDRPATALSGGQQQMAAIGRALMSNPRLLLCDEVSLGLAPIVIGDLYEALLAVCRAGMTTVVVEQDIGKALAVADRVYCLQEGRVSLHGRPRELTRERLAAAYFGL